MVVAVTMEVVNEPVAVIDATLEMWVVMAVMVYWGNYNIGDGGNSSSNNGDNYGGWGNSGVNMCGDRRFGYDNMQLVIIGAN